MKHFNLIKTFLLLFALVVGGGSSAWAEEKTITLDYSSFELTNSYKTKTATVDGFGFTVDQGYKGTGNTIQMNSSKGSGTLYNTTAISGLKSIKVNVASGNKTYTITTGTSQNPTSNIQTGTTGGTYNAKSGDTYFQLKVSGASYFSSIVITYDDSAPVDTRVTTTTIINVPDGFKTDLENGTDVAAGTLTATVTPNGSSALSNPAITWESSDESVATINASTGAVTLKAVGSTTITASYAGDESNYKPSSAAYVLNVVNTYAKGQVNNPYTVTEAVNVINALENNHSISNQYVKGVVSKTGKISNGAVTYFISDDGTSTNQLQVYKGKNINGTNFTNATNLELGEEVVVFGTLKNYNGTTPEFDQDSQIISRQTKANPSFSLDKAEVTLDAYTHEDVDVALTTNTDGLVSCVSSNPDVATVVFKSAGVYTITAQTEGTATITISSAASATYKQASATVSVTVTDKRADAGISFANDAIEKTWGESFTGQVLTNTNSVDVTYSSTDESVATVSSTGAVSVLKAGTTTIKATFSGNATYKAAVASYNLTINKAEANLSYTETSFDVMKDDDSFVAPTLNNPNNLTVTYSSNNENVAVVDENTGEIVLDASAEATVKITATFAGNDNYKNGSANYTINIIDPTKKGSKYNPYTVAEVKNSKATESGIYVVGYIVGNYSAKNPVNPATADTNLALADNVDETAGSNTIPVELQDKGSLREDWGPKSNNLIGYKVLIKGNMDTYFSTSGIKKVTEISAVSVPVSISAAGYATYCSSYPLDFTDITDLTAYTATKVVDGVQFNKVTGKVPANTGLLLSGETTNVPVCESADPVDNLLVGVTTETVKDANTIFVLMNGSKGIGFYKNSNAFTLRANSAYLPAEAVETAGARTFIGFDDETTGIAEMNTQKEDVKRMFDLQGRKVTKAAKGLYIVDGRKVVVK